MVEATKGPARVEGTLRSQQSLLSGEALPRNAMIEYYNTGESEPPNSFLGWLRSLVLKHLYFLGCSLTESAGSGGCGDAACGMQSR